MTRFTRTARRRFGDVSSTIASASRHIVPPNLNSWKIALYLIVFLLPGGSIIVIGMGWFENRQRRKSARAPKPSKAPAAKVLPGPTPCTHGKC
ncbi:hypothetical protein BGLT_05763 [Caballeronia glathei]|jgi:hypothetical protein|uniref:Multidrug ABC transporter ATPase n=1 Tax=Caballeronia glathei TaxID=60547 RepID=A0A069PHH5_9BURK|nr:MULTISPECIES: hypothetical protein [Burkholderiaceae]KDR39817.1 hypothetical protein BG61_29965 [Caballeronia glathei]TCK42129.1 hypothetical protein B0G84_0400 [Paraburkholderia sp. BL8N3]CDY76678.1 hypothetical protein BGLT_05763 [Caballeronia glathei]